MPDPYEEMLKEQAAEYRQLRWELKAWRPSDAPKDRSSTEVTPHDHCEFCWATISAEQAADFTVAYTDEAWHWVCPPCFKVRIKAEADEQS